MQNPKTIDFWDDYYCQLSCQMSDDGIRSQNCCDGVDLAKEWIVQPNDALFKLIHRHLPRLGSKPTYMLEIGCGVSSFARDLHEFVNSSSNKRSERSQYVTRATDVSLVSIELMRKRDKRYIINSEGEFSYDILDILHDMDSTQHYDVVFDKGCLDTILFRSENSLRMNLSARLLNNVHSLLRIGGLSKYLVLSPRKKIKPLREFPGFQRVERFCVSQNPDIIAGDLDGSHNYVVNSNPAVYLYVCTKDEQYCQANIVQSLSVYDFTDKSTVVCPKCKMALIQFTKGLESIASQGLRTCSRRWQNHILHCKG